MARSSTLESYHLADESQVSLDPAHDMEEPMEEQGATQTSGNRVSPDLDEREPLDGEFQVFRPIGKSSCGGYTTFESLDSMWKIDLLSILPFRWR